MGDLEYSNVCHEFKGAMAQGRLKLTDQNIIFKNSKTGKVDQLNAEDIDLINWLKLVNTCGLRIFLKNGTLHRYHGLKESDQEKISKFITQNYNKDLVDKEMSVKGWNWGTAKFAGSLLSFDVGKDTAFEVPLNYVSQCTTGKNEVTVEFHQNDDAPIHLTEMRFFIPSSELAGEDPVDSFHQNVMNKASVISVSGDALAIFRDVPCLNPRGRYDIKMFTSFFQFHGKTYDYKIPSDSVLRLFLLPASDKRQIYFVVSLDPPIKQGGTRYHYLVFLFPLEDDEITVELPYTTDELKEMFDGKLPKELKGQTYEVIGKMMKVVVGRKLTTSSYVGKTDTPAISCSYKAAAGSIYPLERGFMFLRKPPIYIRFEEIASVNFARSGGSTRSFDFEIETKSGNMHTFSSIEKDEYGKLFDFINNKKLTVKNRGKSDKPAFTDDLVDSDQEEPDAYLARVKREAEERDESDGESGESTDEDFNPNQAESDVAEEYDSNAPDTSDSDGEGDSGSDGKEKKKKEKKHKKAITVSEKPRKKREKKEKKSKDKNAPKRPQSAYFLWMNANREKIKKDHPGLSVTDFSKKAGELWRELSDKSEWDDKAKDAKKDYEVAMKEYKASGGGAAQSSDEDDGGKKSKPKKKASKSSPQKMTGGSFKSKEYLSDTGSDSDDDKKKAKKSSKSSGSDSEDNKKSSKAKKSDSEDEEDSDNDKKSKPKKAADKKPQPKKSKKSSEDSDSEDNKKSSKGKKVEAKPTRKRRTDASSKDSGSKKTKEDIVAEEDDEFPEEPEDESTPPTSDASDSD